jgi:NAD(P)-dependent dehydrogenase (short-subunit alcohol dehydrogenase family)
MAMTIQSIPRRGFADDRAGTFVYAASDESPFVTGQVVAVDGAWYPARKPRDAAIERGPE